LDVAWQLVREEGTEALTLGRLAEAAGVTKPVVYDHFITRPGLLAALYQDFDGRQTSLMDAALEASEPTLASRASVIASSYVECVLLQGNEIPGVIAALASSPELEKIKAEYQAIFIEKCRSVLAPFAKGGHPCRGARRTVCNHRRDGRTQWQLGGPVLIFPLAHCAGFRPCPLLTTSKPSPSRPPY
jgi:AcrR family transcriptional regulator